MVELSWSLSYYSSASLAAGRFLRDFVVVRQRSEVVIVLREVVPVEAVGSKVIPRDK